MTDEVAELVLDNNEAQTLALVIARRQALPMVNVHARYIDVLEAEGWLDRGLEFLPDRQADRRAPGRRARAADARVRRAHRLHEERQRRRDRERTDLPDDAAARGRPRRLLPARAARALRRRRSAATRCAGRSSPRGVVNQMVNLSGISFDHRMTEDTGASVVDVTRAWIVAREVLRLRRRCGPRSTPLGGVVAARRPARPVPRLPADGRARRAVAAAPPPPADRHRRPRWPSSGPGIARAGRRLEPVLVGRMADVVHSVEASRLTAGVPEDLAERAGVWPLLHTGFDLVEVAAGPRPRRSSTSPRVDWALFDRLDLMWLWDGDRRAAPLRPLADAGPLGGARRPADRARRADRRPSSTAPAGRSTRGCEANERAVARVAGDVHRDPPGRELRPDDAVGRPAPAAQPRR